MASLGGILDQYRYNAAKIKYLISNGKLADLLNDDESDDNDSLTLQTQEGVDVGRVNGNNTLSVTDAQFAKLVRRHWTEIPALGSEKDDSDSKMTAGQNNDIRRSILVDSNKTRTHASNFVCHGEKKAEQYCQMIDTCQNELILSSAQDQITNGKKLISMPPGLRNLGATCYLNSQLQCLAQNLGFVHGLFTWRQVGAGNRMSQVLTHMQSILARMKYGPQSVICTNEFATALSLENDEMQDPNEVSFLCILYSCLFIPRATAMLTSCHSLLDYSLIECKNLSANRPTIDLKISCRQYFEGHLPILQNVLNVMGIRRGRRILWIYPYQLWMLKPNLLAMMLMFRGVWMLIFNLSC